MLVAFIILCVCSLLFVMAAVMIILGKGDDMIVGYNLASRKTQEKYNRRRLRIMVGCLLLLIAAALPLTGYLLAQGHKEVVMTIFPPAAFALIAGAFTIGHFWVRKK